MIDPGSFAHLASEIGTEPRFLGKKLPVLRFLGKFSRSLQQSQRFLLPDIAASLPLGLTERSPVYIQEGEMSRLSADV